MTDRYRQAAALYQDALDADHRTSMDAAITLIATALSVAYEAGKAEEREACAQVADKHAEDHRLGLCHYGSADKDSGRGRQDGHVTAGEAIAAAIRSREAGE